MDNRTVEICQTKLSDSELGGPVVLARIGLPHTRRRYVGNLCRSNGNRWVYT